MNTFLRRLVARLSIVSLLLQVFVTQSASAQYVAQPFPYKKTFIISAYYSPLPDQEHYVTGSYDGDVRLNGRGVAGADGTPVFPGMIAAPKSYPFGLKMDIPSIGVVSVHDRGGAIVDAGVRGHEHDRLDVWMGYGDIGLERALNWGKRTVTADILGFDDSIKEEIHLKNYTEAEKFIRKTVTPQRLFAKDIWYKSEGEDVEKMQEALMKLGYFKGPVTGTYGKQTLEAVFQFQYDNEIVIDWGDLGAGHFGVQTRALIEEKLKEHKKEMASDGFVNNLSLGDQGADVKRLQEELVRLNLFRVEPNGTYGELTAHAVFKFQQRRNILEAKHEFGAGVFGPTTRKEMNKVYVARKEVKRLIAERNKATATIAKVEDAASRFVADLDMGVKGNSVVLLQKTLKDLGYFKDSGVTNYFGPKTRDALIAFQLEKKIISSVDDTGAGRLGPKTREVLNEFLVEV